MAVGRRGDLEHRCTQILLWDTGVGPGLFQDLSGFNPLPRASCRAQGVGEAGSPLAVLQTATKAFMHMISDELVAWQPQPLPPSIRTPQAACNVCDIFPFHSRHRDSPPSLAEEGAHLPPPPPQAY